MLPEAATSGEFGTAPRPAMITGVKGDRWLPTAKPAPRRTKTRSSIFNTLVFRTNAASGLKTWRRVLHQIRNEQPVYEMCDSGGSLCSPKLRNWRQMLAGLKGLKGKQLLRQLNARANKLVPYREDAVRFAATDYWASPLEFLDAGGDCEDFAILKYVSLTELGVPESSLRVVIADDLRRGQPHAVLTVHMDGKTYILDSLTNKLMGRKAASRYRPRYSVSGDNRWLHVAYRKLASN